MKDLIGIIKKKEYGFVFKFVALAITITAGFLLLGNDMTMVIRWNLALALLGFAMLPISLLLFGSFGNKVYFLSQILGLMLVSYCVWLLSRFKIARFGRISIVIVLFIALLINCAFLFIGNRKKTDENEAILSSRLTSFDIETVISIEIAVLLIHVLTTWLLGLKIPGNGTERLMDVAFMISMDKSAYMAPLDMWASGCTINYYYFGQYMMTFLSKMSFVDVKFGYSLALSMIMTFCIIGSFSIAEMLLERCNRVSKKTSVFGGVIAALSVSFAGNCHYLVFYRLAPMLRTIIGLPKAETEYWFPDSTRYIGYIPENVTDRTISEFPFYSFIIGDLHAHVIDILLVILMLGITLSYCFNEKKKDDRKISDIFNLNIIFLGITIGIVSMTNYWDYLIYFIVCGSLILAANIKNGWKHMRDFRQNPILVTAIQGVLVYLISYIIGLPFMLQFDKMINGIGIVKSRSYIHQLIILWGLFITIVIIFIKHVIVEKLNEKNDLILSDILIIMLGLCAIGLVILPEIVFVKDIYIDGAPRANTMFKLTYQAFILFGLVTGYTFARIISTYINSILENSNCRIKIKVPALCVLIWIMTLGYPFTSVRMWMGEYKTLTYKGIDSTQTILDAVPEEKEALKWISENIESDKIILTAYGDSYSDACIIPALSGNPTILGWITHEWLWRNGYEFDEEREKVVDEIYEGSDATTKQNLCEKYNVDYIYIGSAERNRYYDINFESLQQLGTIVYYNNSYGTYIIELDK